MLRGSLVLTVVVAIAIALGGRADAAGGQWRSLGMYPAVAPGGAGPTAPLPMVDSRVSVTVTGAVVEAVVTQTFVNRSDRPTEATYIFPLPPDAAVTAMSIAVGNRTLVAAIEPREAAQRRYEAAVRDGVQAALLEQERSDVFTQTIAAVPAQGTVTVTLRFDALARHAAGTWSLALPMVVAPRYVPGTASGRGTTGSGRAADTDRAPDASRITPGASPGGGGATQVQLAFTDAVASVTSATHALTKTAAGYAFTDARTDHDAVIRWTTQRPAAGWIEPTSQGGYAAIVVQAEAAGSATRKPLRATVILDHAATMKGDAAAVAQPFVRTWLASLPVEARLDGKSPADAQRAFEPIWSGTSRPFDLSRVLQTAKPGGAPIVLVTDGLVADDRAVLAAGKRLGVPVHIIAVGPAPARGLLEKLAAVTGGTVRFVLPSDELAPIAAALTVDLTTTAPTLAINWGALAVSDVVPAVLPRLGTGQAIVVVARLTRRAATANVRVRGELFAIETLPTARPLAGAVTTAGPLARRWAKLRLDDLLVGGGDAAVVTAHALAFGLVSPFTTLVAIGDRVDVQGGVRHSVAVPVSVPAGMHWVDVKQETLPIAGGEISQTQRDAPSTVTSRDDKKNAPQAEPKPEAKPVATVDADGETAKAGKRAADDDEAEEGIAAQAAGAPAAPSIEAVSYERASMTITGATTSRMRTRSGRYTLLGGVGFARADGATALEIAVGARVERVVRSALLGGEATLLVLREDATDLQGRALATAGAFLGRSLEVGAGGGVQFGAGLGPAWSLAVRLHVLGPAPLALFVRYDGALLRRDDANVLQQGLVLGVEWGF